MAAEDRFAALREAFGDRVGLVHGQMKAAERDAAMEAFALGRTAILVATTVIEVGVDIPEASIMVIEHAERFGLAQLHQLRGRVGRGQAKSVCLLLYKGPLGESAKARIETMRETEDGFRIADEDLRLRGEGELIGTKQSGLPDFKLALLDQHGRLLEEARREAAGPRGRRPAAPRAPRTGAAHPAVSFRAGCRSETASRGVASEVPRSADVKAASGHAASGSCSTKIIRFGTQEDSAPAAWP